MEPSITDQSLIHKPNVIYIYTDGSCNNMTGTGGFGCVIIKNGCIKMIAESHNNTTNNRMELSAVITALSTLTESRHKVCVFTDSKYVVNGFSKIVKWAATNFQTVKNSDVWSEAYKQYVRLDNLHNISIRWVKGHDGLLGNEIADKLASLAYKSLLGYTKILNKR